MRPSIPEAPTASFPLSPLRLVPGGAIQFPGGSFIPLWTSAFSRRTMNSSVSVSYEFGSSSGARRLKRLCTLVELPRVDKAEA
jgi:hypothetical protein